MNLSRLPGNVLASPLFVCGDYKVQLKLTPGEA